jgi:glycosyltransferase involved in cell wall biosynthesis
LDLYGPFDKHDPDFRDSVLGLLQTCTHVRWLGAVPFDRVRETVSTYRVFVNLSYSEGLPVSVLEAAAEGLYLVLSDIPQHRLLNLPACAFVSPDHPTFTGVLTNTQRGIMNRDYVRQAFSLEGMIREYLMLYEEILCAREPRMSSTPREASGRV